MTAAATMRSIAAALAAVAVAASVGQPMPSMTAYLRVANHAGAESPGSYSVH